MFQGLEQEKQQLLKTSPYLLSAEGSLFLMPRPEREGSSQSSFCLLPGHNSRIQVPFVSRMGDMVRKQKQKQTKQKQETHHQINPTSSSGFLSHFACLCLFFKVFRKLSNTFYTGERHELHTIQCAHSPLSGTTHLLATVQHKIPFKVSDVQKNVL